jgi:hypothetical protein
MVKLLARAVVTTDVLLSVAMAAAVSVSVMMNTVVTV